jgi:assimilatory nitrate reductase catalytic subunit
MYPQRAYVELSPKDARQLKINHAQCISVATRRGRVRVQASITPTVQPGQLFMPMHYPETNLLTYPQVDPYSRQPAYKHCAAKLLVDFNGGPS